jgi:signal transduction histidine kinase
MRTRSLRVRLLVMFMLVTILAIGSVTLLVSNSVTGAFQQYIGHQQESNQQFVAQLLSTFRYDPRKGQIMIEQVAQTNHTRILLIDRNDRILADSSRQLTYQSLTVTALMELERKQQGQGNASSAGVPPINQPVHIISTENRDFSFGLAPLTIGKNAPEASFFSTVNSAVLQAVMIAGLIALLLALVLSHTILKPIRALTLAASRMEQGDLSQRVQIRANDEIGGLAHAFNTMAQSLDRSEQLRRNLISDVAHELRTPLTNIRGYLEAVLDAVVEPDPTVIVSLYEEALLLTRLVTDLQDLTLAEAGQLRLHVTPIALQDIITTAANGLSLQASKQELSLTIEIPTDLPVVEADSQRVGQIVRNLLSNAIKYTPAGGAIGVSAWAVGQEVEICVKDTGVGIAAEHLPSLFKRFYRADPSRTRATGGTGLGLAIVEQLVHAHGGRVAVESQVGQGTSFTFTLPVALV